MMEDSRPDSAEDVRGRLTPLQYRVTQEKATERAFTGEFYDCHDDGTYNCVVCGAPLFHSDTKFDSGSGWPSFTTPVDEAAVGEEADRSHGAVRTEVHCADCGAHLGHVFPDGPHPTGLRYCVNSASLDLDRSAGGSKLPPTNPPTPTTVQPNASPGRQSRP